MGGAAGLAPSWGGVAPRLQATNLNAFHKLRKAQRKLICRTKHQAQCPFVRHFPEVRPLLHSRLLLCSSVGWAAWRRHGPPPTDQPPLPLQTAAWRRWPH